MKTVTLIENKEKGDYVIINDGETTMLAPVKAFLDRDDVDDFIVNFNSVNDKTEKFKSVMINAGVYKRSLKELMYMLNVNDTSEFVIDNQSMNMLEQALVGARTMVGTIAEPGKNSEPDYQLNVEKGEIHRRILVDNNVLFLKVTRDDRVYTCKPGSHDYVEIDSDEELGNLIELVEKHGDHDERVVNRLKLILNRMIADKFQVIVRSGDVLLKLSFYCNSVYFSTKVHGYDWRPSIKANTVSYINSLLSFVIKSNDPDKQHAMKRLELVRDNMILEKAISERGFDYDLLNIARIYHEFSREEESRLVSFMKSINDVKGDDFIILYGSDSMAMIVKIDSNLYFFSKNHEDTMITWEKCDSGLDFKWVLNCERTYNTKLPAAIKEIASSELNKIVERCTKLEEQDNTTGDQRGEDGKNGDDVAGQVPDVDQEYCMQPLDLEWLETKYKLNEEMEKRELVTKPLIKSLTYTNLKPGDDGYVEGRIKGFNMEYNEFPRGEEGKEKVEFYYNNCKDELLREIKERETDVALIYPSKDNHEVVGIEYFHDDDEEMLNKVVEMLKDGLYFRLINYHAEQEYTIVMYLGHEDVEENGTKVYKSMIEVPAIGFKRYNYLASDVIRKIEDYMKSDECKKFVMKNWKNFKPTNNEPSTVKLENITRIYEKKYFTVSFQQIMDGVAKVNI